MSKVMMGCAESLRDIKRDCVADVLYEVLVRRGSRWEDLRRSLVEGEGASMEFREWGEGMGWESGGLKWRKDLREEVRGKEGRLGRARSGMIDGGMGGGGMVWCGVVYGGM